jgi:hypothetical protein
MGTERVTLRVSPQGQVTLRQAVLEALEFPKRLECWVEKGTLMLRPLFAETLDEAEAYCRKHGITRDMIYEAVRIQMRKEAEAKRAAEAGTTGAAAAEPGGAGAGG